MSQETPTATVCVNHPNRSTMLRCNRCSNPICPDCAILTPTGYRCKDCVRGQQKIFETVKWIDYPIGIAIAGILSFVGSFIASYLGFFGLLIGPVAGVGIAEVVRWAIQRRRGKWLFLSITGAAVLGGLPLLLLGLFGRGGLFSLVFLGGYVFLVTSTVYYRLSGIRIR